MSVSLAVTARLALIADEIRSLSNNGLHYGSNPYDIDRYQRLLKMAAELLSMAATQPLDEIERVFVDDIGIHTPLAGVDAAVVDEMGRILLIQRADNHLWAMPGGACEVGDTPAENAAREVWEETGYRVEITRLLGIFDNSRRPIPSLRHGYLMLFQAKVVDGEATVSNESLAVEWFSLEAIPWDRLSPGHYERLQHVVKWRRDPSTPPYFD